MGAHHGDDTAHYLARGFRVVAIEAYPNSVTLLRDRFRSEMASGRLRLVDRAVGPNSGDVDFYVSGRSSGSCSILAEGVGEITEVIKVESTPFSQVLRECGVPYYVKIDIQGMERHVLESLDPGDLPAYVSWEMDRDQVECLRLVRELGYRRFKLIDQHSFLEMERAFGLRPRMWRKLIRGLERSGLVKARASLRSLHPDHSSGPFGEDTDGRWRGFESVVQQWTDFNRKYPNRERRPSWFDCHAAR